MSSNSSDTIYALSSGGLPSGVAVVRVSGPAAGDILSDLCGGSLTPRRAALRWIRDRNNQKIDQALAIWFPRPNSFSGEDCVEFQLHGGRAVVAAVLGLIGNFAGVRHAEAGEFTRRAFENGKLDLVEIEGLSDLIRAETEMQRRLASQQADGGLSQLYAGWAAAITRCRALIEAELDFADEGDVPESAASLIWREVSGVSAAIRRHLAGSKATEIVRDGYNVVIAGPPNCGKSSLLNYLAKRDVAIVTDIAGTTRDLLVVELDLDGFFVRLTDTAGLRETEDQIEREGIKRSLHSIERADLTLALGDSGESRIGIEDNGTGKIVKVRSKIDLSPGLSIPADEIGISTKTGTGIDSLLKRILSCLAESADFNAAAFPVRARHVGLLESCISELDLALASVDSGLEIRAENLRRAGHFLGKITGVVDVEDLLGVIFSEFCIGK